MDGPRTELCGTPDVTHVLSNRVPLLSDRAPLSETLCFRCEINYFIPFLVFPDIPYVFMRDFVKGFGEIMQDGIYMCLVIYSCYPVMEWYQHLPVQVLLSFMMKPSLQAVHSVDELQAEHPSTHAETYNDKHLLACY